MIQQCGSDDGSNSRLWIHTTPSPVEDVEQYQASCFALAFVKPNYPETPNDKPMHVAQAAKDKYQKSIFVAKA